MDIEEPKTSLKILFWNSGDILTRIQDVQRLLVQTRPHLLLVQEARSINGNHNALIDECRAVGYLVSQRRIDGLVCVWLRGVSVAPLKITGGQEHTRIRRIAVLLAEHRLLIRHIHAPSQADQSSGSMTAGDFNSRPIGNSLVRVLFAMTEEIARVNALIDALGLQFDKKIQLAQHGS